MTLGRLRQIAAVTDPAGRDIRDDVASFLCLPLGWD
jgi:hypothetical protein